ncbi:MAG: serine protease, partial [Oscillospiraceae bacterium]|nr:serine protease [Oscillospiraceae bacterium]
YGTFNPNSNIKRSEIAAICVRLAVPGERSAKPLAEKPQGRQKLSATQISDKCASAVFYIDIYGMCGDLLGSGSGFFISDDGLALTNYHVAANSSCLTATMTDGTVYSAIDVIDYDSFNDLVLLRVHGAEGRPYLTLGDSSAVKQGETVYAIGSPLGLSNTMSAGIVSNVSRVLDGVTYIQTSAQITHGSSGGALVNEYGEAVGVTCGGFDSYGDLNLAVPINYVSELDRSSQDSYYVWDLSWYEGFNYAIDFGAFAGLYYTDIQQTDWGTVYVYSINDFRDSPVQSWDDNFYDTIYYYENRLLNNGLEFVGGDDEKDIYEGGDERVTLAFDYSRYLIRVIVQWVPQYYEKYPDILDFGWLMEVPLTNSQERAAGSTYWYSYSGVYTYSEMTTICENYAYIVADAGYPLKDATSNSWKCEGKGLSVLIMQNAATVTVYFSVTV